jgi:hypothetical protein
MLGQKQVIFFGAAVHLKGMGGSSSGRKQARIARGRASFRPQRPPADGETPVQIELDFADHAITSGVGFDILCRMGFEPNHLPLPAGPGRPPTPGGAHASTCAVDNGPSTGLAPLPAASGGESDRSQPIKIMVRTTRAGLGSGEVLHAHSLPARVGAGASTNFGSQCSGAAGPAENHRHLVMTTSCDPCSATTLVSSLDSLSLGALANDPLRPRCGFNSEHVVADLKQKQRHEKRCRDNPNRNSRRSLSPGGSAAFFQPSGPSYGQHQAAEQPSSLAENDLIDQDMSEESDLISDMSSHDE